MLPDRRHYERAFEEYLRSRRIPYVSVDEARKALVPEGARFGASEPGPAAAASLKSFDFVIYGQGQNLLIDVKGRRVGGHARPVAAPPTQSAAGSPRPPGLRRRPVNRRWRLESWVTQEDVDSLTRWRQLFGPDFDAGFVFVYWCQEQPPDALFQEVFEHRSRWYALRVVTLSAYVAVMKQRSARWRTVDLPAAAFERVSRPFAPARQGPASWDRAGGAEADLGPELPVLQPYASTLVPC